MQIYFIVGSHFSELLYELPASVTREFDEKADSRRLPPSSWVKLFLGWVQESAFYKVPPGDFSAHWSIRTIG